MEQKYYKILTSKNTSPDRGFDYTPISQRMEIQERKHHLLRTLFPVVKGIMLRLIG